MPRVIIRIQDEPPLYCLWSTVVDCPVGPVLDRKAFSAWYKRYCNEFLGEPPLKERMARVDDHGTSFIPRELGSGIEIAEVNRAGEHEACLSIAEIIRRYGPDGDLV